MLDELVLPPGKTALTQASPAAVPQAQQRVVLGQPAPRQEPQLLVLPVLRSA